MNKKTITFEEYCQNEKVFEKIFHALNKCQFTASPNISRLFNDITTANTPTPEHLIYLQEKSGRVMANIDLNNPNPGPIIEFLNDTWGTFRKDLLQQQNKQLIIQQWLKDLLQKCITDCILKGGKFDHQRLGDFIVSIDHYIDKIFFSYVFNCTLNTNRHDVHPLARTTVQTAIQRILTETKIDHSKTYPFYFNTKALYKTIELTHKEHCIAHDFEILTEEEKEKIPEKGRNLTFKRHPLKILFIALLLSLLCVGFSAAIIASVPAHIFITSANIIAHPLMLVAPLLMSATVGFFIGFMTSLNYYNNKDMALREKLIKEDPFYIGTEGPEMRVASQTR